MPDPRAERVRTKICGVRRPEDARAAVAAGAHYVGAILSPGFGRSVEPSVAAGFVEDGEAVLVGVLVDAETDEVLSAARVARARVIQLHGEEPPGVLRALRSEGDWRLWKAVRVRDADDIGLALDRWVGVADGILLDGHRQGRVGGGGVSFPWEALEAVRDQVPASLALVVAGGLTPENVGEAVRRLAPDVVDVSSGVESRPGVKDPERIRAFVESVRRAAADIGRGYEPLGGEEDGGPGVGVAFR